VEGKQAITEFPVLVMDAHEGRELGRFTRYVVETATTSDPPCNTPPRAGGVAMARPVSLAAALVELDQYLQQLIGLTLDQVGQPGGEAAFATCGVWDCNLVHKHCRANEIRPPAAAFSTWVDVSHLFGEEHHLKEVRGVKAMLSQLKLLDKEGRPKYGLHHPFGLHYVEHLARAVLDLLQRGVAFHVTSEIGGMEPQRGEAPRWVRAMDRTEDAELQEAWGCFGSSSDEDDEDDEDDAEGAPLDAESLPVVVFARYGNIRRLFGTLLERDAVYDALRSAGYEGLVKTFHKIGTSQSHGRWEIQCKGQCFEVHQGFEDNAAPPQPLVDTIVQGTKGWRMETLDNVAVALGHGGPDWAPRPVKAHVPSTHP